jgi:hypothetical protein
MDASKPRFYKGKPNEGILNSISSLLHACEESAKGADYSTLLSCQQKILFSIEKMDASDKRFVKGMLQKGKLKIASTLYAQGISLGNASEITGTDKREVLSYAGQSMMFDRMQEKKSMESRMKELREIFS